MATELTISVPDEYVSLILDSFNTLADKNLEISSQDEDLRGQWIYSFVVKQTGETNADFARRVIKEMIRAHVRLVDYSEDEDRYRTEISAIDPPAQDIPDEIVD